VDCGRLHLARRTAVRLASPGRAPLGNKPTVAVAVAVAVAVIAR
jgi:hypothetical protein